MTSARTLALAAALALAPTATAHADNRDYVESGQYLADVTAAAAPASAWLLARTDAIARQADLCRTAGFPLQGATLTPPARDTGSGATLARAGAPASGAVSRAAAGGGSSAAPYGATTLTLDRVSLLSRARVRATAVAPATAKGRAYNLPVARGAMDVAAGSFWSEGGIRLTRGGRSVVVKDVRVDLDRKKKGRLVGAVGGRRMTVATFAAPKDLTLRPLQARARAVPATLTPVAAKALGRALKVALRSGRVGTLALRADLRKVVPESTNSPGPTAPAPSSAPPTPGEPGLTVVPATREVCAATPAHPALVLDLDETALSNYIDTWGDPNGGDAGQAGPAMFGQSTALAPILDIYNKARARDVAVFFITARPGIIETTTRDNLRRVGYTAYEGLSFKNDLAAAKDVYKTAERAAVEARGYRIILNVGDQQTDLDGGHAERAFKLPNPFY